MKEFPTPRGPYPLRLIYETAEIDGICEDALLKVGCLPQEPERVKIDRFLEKFFEVPILYEEIGEGIMGCTVFNRSGKVMGIAISPKVEADGTKPAERRARSTLAHEGGHGLLHPKLFISDSGTGALMEHDRVDNPRILCRANDIGVAKQKVYDGNWWEWQANRAIAGLLLPKRLVAKALAPFLIKSTLLPVLPEESRQKATMEIAATFDVNPAVARIRLQEMYPIDLQMLL